MHLAPRDHDKILLHQVGSLAQKRLARGVKLNVTEATALIGEHVASVFSCDPLTRNTPIHSLRSS